jgi:hypothetical protein
MNHAALMEMGQRVGDLCEAKEKQPPEFFSCPLCVRNDFSRAREIPL